MFVGDRPPSFHGQRRKPLRMNRRQVCKHYVNRQEPFSFA